jgi:L-rhamnose mutarotase
VKNTVSGLLFPEDPQEKSMQRFCFTLHLRSDPALIAEYVELHRDGRPEIHQSIRDAGVIDMQIYLIGNQLFMIIDTTDSFTLEKKAAMDLANPAVVEWERLMGRFQEVDEMSDPTKRWRLIEKVFQLA